MRHVEAHFEVELDGKRHDALIMGVCDRDMTSRIQCDVRKVLVDGVDRLSDVPEEQMAPMRVRLACAHVATVGVRDHVDEGVGA